jgi:hypothetical protein
VVAIDSKNVCLIIRRIALSTVMLSGVLAANASAEDYGVAQSYLHSFSNNVTVYTEVFALNKDISLETSAYFKYTVDFINPSFGGDGGGEGEGGRGMNGGGKAGVQQRVAAVSTASSAATAAGTSSDVRNELTAGFSHQFGYGITAEVYYDYSREKDYLSNTPNLTLKKDLFEKNTTLTLSYSRNMDLVSGLFMDGQQSRTTDNYFMGITQLLSPVTFVQMGYSGSRASGYMQEGNRLVPISPTTAAQCTDKVAGSCEEEVFPNSRKRNAYIVGLNHYFDGGLMDRSAVKLSYRYYKDDWDIVSHTEDVEYDKYLTDENLIGLNLRYYRQTGAFFVKDIYTASDLYRSASQQLQALHSEMVGVKFVHTFKTPSYRSQDLSDGIQLGSAEIKYEYYTESIHVTGHTVMLGLRFKF